MIFRLFVLFTGLMPLSLSAVEKTSEKITKVPSMAGSVMSVVIALIFIIIVILVCAWLLRRLGGNQFHGNSAIEVKASHMLGTKERLVIIKVDGRHLLLGVTPQNIQRLDELSDTCIPVKSDAPVSFQQAFSSQVKKMMGKTDEQ